MSNRNCPSAKVISSYNLYNEQPSAAPPVGAGDTGGGMLSEFFADVGVPITPTVISSSVNGVFVQSTSNLTVSNVCCPLQTCPQMAFEFYYASQPDINEEELPNTVANNALIPFPTKGAALGFTLPNASGTIFPVPNNGVYEITYVVAGYVAGTTNSKMEIALTTNSVLPSSGIIPGSVITNGIATSEGGASITGVINVRLLAGQTISVVNVSGSTITLGQNTSVSSTNPVVNNQLTIKQIA